MMDFICNNNRVKIDDCATKYAGSDEIIMTPQINDAT